MKLAGKIISPYLQMCLQLDTDMVFLHTHIPMIDIFDNSKCYHIHIRTVMMDKMV